MLPSSLAVVLTALGFALLALVAFAWGWWHGHFDNLDEQARAPFEPRDCLLERPWETAQQRAERQRQYGAPVEPEPGEWGGAE
jgi:nitrogen fixation-related uncharacterized protein